MHLFLSFLIHLFSLVKSERYYETKNEFSLTIFFSAYFGEFNDYKEFKNLTNTISIVADSDCCLPRIDDRNKFAQQLSPDYDSTFKIISTKDKDTFFMHEKSLNLTLVKIIERNFSYTTRVFGDNDQYLYNRIFSRLLHKIVLKNNNTSHHPFNLILLNSRYFRSAYELLDDGLLNELYVQATKLIEEEKEPAIAILSECFNSQSQNSAQQLLSTTFNSSDSKWKICADGDGKITFDVIMFYSHSVSPLYVYDINITDCQKLSKFTQRADLQITYKIEKTTQPSTTATSTSSSSKTIISEKHTALIELSTAKQAVTITSNFNPVTETEVEVQEPIPSRTLYDYITRDKGINDYVNAEQMHNDDGFGRCSSKIASLINTTLSTILGIVLVLI